MLDKIREYLHENYDIDKDAVSEESELGNDLDLTSFQLVEICAELEDEFDVEISEEDLPGIITIGDLMNVIIRNGGKA
ncbi:MAG: phosphopantetheine-binding protein [Clostridiales bacterium]|nr:phosphopantetheine-binding protein [Clostridiales bacterium]